MAKPSITVVQKKRIIDDKDTNVYVVSKAVNTLDWSIDQVLSKRDLQYAIDVISKRGGNVTIV